MLFIRGLRPLSGAEKSQQQDAMAAAHYTGSQACAKCHQEIYDRWKKTPMANVVRDPREHPEAIIPNLASDPIAKFSKEQVALVCGSIWKQRYFTRIGDDYYPEPAHSGQHEAAHGADVQWLPLGRLQHSDKASRGVERGLRTLPRTRKRTCSQADAREYHQSRAARLCPGQ